MDLFAAAGVDLKDSAGGKARRAVPRSLRVPLFNFRVVENARRKAIFDPSEAELEAARAYARKARSARFSAQKETAVRNLLYDEVLGGLLGYARFDPERPYTLAFEKPIRNGSVDVALGRFGAPDAADAVLAPLEMKGPATRDLDAVLPGRGRSPVQQAWDYAVDAPGARWVLVCNCVELRLYGFGRGRDAYEVFDLTLLDNQEEHQRLWLLLSAERLLGGATEELLRETDSAYRAITDELYRDYSELRTRLIGFLTNPADGPGLTLGEAIEPAQKLLDRILFIAFAQRNGLLPERLLERAIDSAKQNFIEPQPIWKNFLGLFRHIDRGAPRLYINGYNGGLFARAPVVDELILPDDLAESVATLGHWDYRDDVPVTLLGHIFEQSITDLEALRAESRGLPAPVVTQRRREGVVYTPEPVTRFIVERTIGLTLRERRTALLAERGRTDPAENGGLIFAAGEGDAERAFWRGYASALRDLTIVDPACGSGAFLVAAFDYLAAEYRRVVGRLADLGETVDFDSYDEIVTRNLFGVDLNPESVEIARLALWLKTARRQHRLQSLADTIKVGNSLIEDAAFTDRPFDWRAAFPQVFARGGFDVAIGNPPYVRMELVKPFKPYLAERYEVAADRADLYAYFFERGLDVLKEGGRLGYVSSSTFFRTGSGENLRAFLSARAAAEAVVDFGDLQIFEGVTTYPAIVTLRKGGGPDGELQFLNVRDRLPDDLATAFEDDARPMPRARLTARTWRFEEEPLARLRDKIAAGRPTLGEVYGAPLYGIKTGLNEAFVIDTPTRDRLVSADPRSAELLKPFLRGEDVKRWHTRFGGKWLVFVPQGWTRENLSLGSRKARTDAHWWQAFVKRYPAISAHLAIYEIAAKSRSDQGDFWWELRPCSYYSEFQTHKIIYPYLMSRGSFSFDEERTLTSKTTYFIPRADTHLLSLLNSNAAWFFLEGNATIKAGNYREIMTQYLEHLPLPLNDSHDSPLQRLGRKCTDAAGAAFNTSASVRARMLDLLPSSVVPKPSRKLDAWWSLDFAGFRREIKRAFRAEIPVKERGDWERYLAENGAEVRRLMALIAAAERDIDAAVYRLFDLTAEEIALLEASLAGKTPDRA